MSKILDDMRAAFAGEFMQPECYLGADIEFEIFESGLDLESDKYYSRLSARGFLDCTDWLGPFDTLDEAAQALIDTYAGDEA